MAWNGIGMAWNGTAVAFFVFESTQEILPNKR
jgi:hypothetical protein